MNTTQVNRGRSGLADLVPMNVLSPAHRKDLLEHALEVVLEPGESFGTNQDDTDFTYYLLEGEFDLYEGERLLESMSSRGKSARFAINRLRSTQIHGRASSAVTLLQIDISLVSTLLIWMQSLARRERSHPERRR